MARSRKDPKWLTRLLVDAVHNDQIREHGGFAGIRDEAALESALARPLQKWHYQPNTDLPALAAAYAFGLIRNHPCRDGNKRISFLSLVTFLGLNGYDLTATDETWSPSSPRWPPGVSRKRIEEMGQRALAEAALKRRRLTLP